MSRVFPVDVQHLFWRCIPAPKVSSISSLGETSSRWSSRSDCCVSRSLAAECLPRGIYVQSLCPGYVVSKLSGIRKASLMAPTPNQFVRSSLDRVTLPFTTGYWTHEIQVRDSAKDRHGEKVHLHSLLGLDSLAVTRILVEQSDDVCSRWRSSQSFEKTE